MISTLIIDPLIVSGIITAASAVVGSIVSYGAAKKQSDTSEKNTADTNATNIALAEKSNQWNIEQWNRENQYNSPKSQVERMERAGVNPAFGNVESGNAGNLTAVTPQVQPVDYSPSSNVATGLLSGISQIINSFSSARKSEQETRKIEQETNILHSDAEFRDALNSGQLDLLHSQLSLNVSQEKLRRGEFDLLKNKASLLDNQRQMFANQCESILADIQLKQSENEGQILDNYYKTPMYLKQIEKLQSDIGVSRAEAKKIAQDTLNQVVLGKQLKLDYSINFATRKLGVKNKFAESSLLWTAGETAKFNFGQLQRYSDADHIFNYSTGLLQGLGGVLSGYGNFRKGGSSSYQNSPNGYTVTY